MNKQKEKAIFELYSNVKVIDTSDNGVMVCYDENRNIINNIDMTAVETKATELQTAEDNAKAQKEADALAGNNKLLELGLTQAQVTAMTGYTPPVSE